MEKEWKATMRCTDKVYINDKIIERILEKLGTTKNIARNPYVIEKVVRILYEIMLQRDFKISGVNVAFGMITGECEENEIDSIVKLLTNNEEKPEKTPGDEEDKSGIGTEYGISIDSSTQELTLLTVMFSPPYSKEQVIKDTFRDLEGEEGVGETIERVEGWQKTEINSDGIVMQRKWNEQPGITAIKMRRMPDDPIIIEITEPQRKLQYCCIKDFEQIPSLMGNTTNFFPGTLEWLRKKYEMKDSPGEVKKTNQYRRVIAKCMESDKKFGRYECGIRNLCEATGVHIYGR